MLEALVPRPVTAPSSKSETFSATKIVDNPISHPRHYTYGKIETIDFIEDKQLNFSRGNAVKYIVRAGHKTNELEDLEKAKWYIEREIERIKKERNT